MTQDRQPVLAASCLLLAAFALTWFAGCDTTPDKRLLQNLNTQGFGNRYSGNAEEENWVAIGDRIQVTDSYHSKALVADVDIDGMALLPELGFVDVAGRSANEIQALLIDKYRPYQGDIDLHVMIRTTGERYCVWGEVQAQGPRLLDSDLFVEDAVMGAIPNHETADLHHVDLWRNGKKVATLDLCRDSNSTNSGRWLRIGPGDILYVPAIPETEPEPTPIQGQSILLADAGGRS